MDETIFVQIASYRDEELEKTVDSVIGNAKFPENLRFAINRQYLDENDMTGYLKKYRKDKRFKFIDTPIEYVIGVGDSRRKTQLLYNGEDYTLQLDAHIRMDSGWDEGVISLFKELQNKGHAKPIITGYPPRYYYVDKKEVFDSLESVSSLYPDHIDGFGFLHMSSYRNLDARESPAYPSAFIAAGFLFTAGRFCEEVPYENYYFNGEEAYLSAMSFLKGYSIFQPKKAFCWHLYASDSKNKYNHGDDFPETRQYMETESQKLHAKLFGIGQKPAIENIEEYEWYAGVSFSERKLHKNTINKNPPPAARDELFFKNNLELTNPPKAEGIRHIEILEKEPRDAGLIEYKIIVLVSDSGEELDRSRLTGGDAKNPVKPIPWDDEDQEDPETIIIHTLYKDGSYEIETPEFKFS